MPEIIVALDVPTVKQAEKIVERTGADWYKVGLELAFADGAREFVRNLPNVFLDLKLRDIPTTVGRAARNIAEQWRPQMLSVTAAVSDAMRATEGMTHIVHVPNLTSDHTASAVPSNAWGVVCRASLATEYRILMPWAKIIVPGIRPSGTVANDHRETVERCPEADYIVIGRPITRAENPRAALQQFQ